MNDEQLLRYARHILLDEIGIDGQQRFLDAHVLVIGAGGLGSAALLYLGSAGVGQLTVVDDDLVDLSNLQRQIAHTLARVGSPKVASAQVAVAAINPGVRFTALQQRADPGLLAREVPLADVVLDCSDNFTTRQAINAACVRHGVPLVSGAAIRLDAQIAVYHPGLPQSPCYACVFPPDTAPEETACATMGVFAPLVGVVGAMQAGLALQLLGGLGERLVGRLVLLNGATMAQDEMRIARNPHCPVCGAHGAHAPENRPQ